MDVPLCVAWCVCVLVCVILFVGHMVCAWRFFTSKCRYIWEMGVYNVRGVCWYLCVLVFRVYTYTHVCSTQHARMMCVLLSRVLHVVFTVANTLCACLCCGVVFGLRGFRFSTKRAHA